MGLIDQASQLLLEPRDELACPECDVLLEEEYVRDPLTQDHFRGVEALVCSECGYAQRIGTGD